jgi:hypothetical protein
MDQRLAPDAFALLTDRLVRFFARRTHDIQRHASHIGNHDSAVGRFALDLRRARIGVCFRSGALGRIWPEFSNDVAVFGVHAMPPSSTSWRCAEFVVIHHQRALVGGVFERVDAAIDDSISSNTCSPTM